MIPLVSKKSRRWFVRALVLVLALAVISPLAACGRKGAPAFPEGSKYPRDYPSE